MEEQLKLMDQVTAAAIGMALRFGPKIVGEILHCASTGACSRTRRPPCALSDQAAGRCQRMRPRASAPTTPAGCGWAK